MKTTPFNLYLIIVGLILVAVGLFRSYPVQLNKQFLLGNVPPTVALVVMVILAYKVGGMKFVMAGIDGTARTTSSFLITLVTLMPLIAFGSVVAHHFEHSIGDALRGRGGYAWATVSAFSAPGGSSLSGIVNRLWATQHDIRPLLLYFMSVVPLISFTIYIIRRLGLTEDIALAMYKVNWMITTALIPVFWVYQKFFYK